MGTEEKIKKRLFIAVDLPEEVKSDLYDRAKHLSTIDRDIRPVTLSNIHLTLRFLGPTLPGSVKKISDAVKRTALEIRKFDFTLGEGLGAFPDTLHARIIFVPVRSGEEDLKALFVRLEENLSKVKIRKEKRKFISHLTVARIKNFKNITDLFKNLEIKEYVKIKCEKITIFESLLKPTGAEYVILSEFELK